MFGFTPLRRTYSAALRDLASAKPEVRASAAQDLGLVGDASPREAADALAPLLGDPTATVRSAALTALATLAARHLVDAIARRLDDVDPTVRQVATMALAEVGGELAMAHLRGALAHAQPDVRFQALLGILDMDPHEGLALAVRALASDDVWIASEAAVQIGAMLGPTPAPTTLPRRDALLEIPAATRTAAVTALSDALDSPYDRLTICAAIALARAGDSRAVPVLSHFVLGRRTVEGDDAGELTAEAIAALGTAPTEVSGEARAALEVIATRVLPTGRRRLARDALAVLSARTYDNAR